ncbi:hypothetical protein K9M06_05825 [Candidatus Bipolaricaulota bacterium]|nr:hypothetical protein [Candidatus Bipolaricaulota bacterium]
MKKTVSVSLTLVLVLTLLVSLVGFGQENFTADLLIKELRRAEQLINDGEVQQGLESLRGVQSILNSKISEFSPDDKRAGVSALKVGYVNATEAFTVFTDAVKEERQSAQAKDEELRSIREKAIQGEISKSEYQKQADILQAEKLKAQLEIDMAMVEKMRSAPGFESVSDQLKKLSNQVQPIMDELNSTLKNMRQGSAVPKEVNNTLSQINSQYQQLDDLLTKLIESKIFQIANVRASEAGYDLVLRQENVVLYGNQETVDNLTGMTKKALQEELSG